MPASISPAADLRASLHALSETLSQVHFALPGEARPGRETLRHDTLWSINEYLLPRLGDLEAPLVVVLIGSTGSGKSTIVNSLATRRISEPGAIRPTTTMPVVWAHHDDHTYIGRPYRPFGRFASILDSHNASGFGIIPAAALPSTFPSAQKDV